jgi:peptide/nickel transport system substrate-binding protein
MRSTTERTGMRRLLRYGVVAAVVAASAVIAGCGSSSSSSSSAGAGKVVTGGTITVLWSGGGIDNLDPGYWYYQTDYSDLMHPTQRQLYSYAEQGIKAVPDLATGLPVVSGGGTTLTFHIKSGIRYSPPLQNQTVTTSDIKYAIERCFLASVGNGYSSLYYSSIVGAPSGPASSLPNMAGLQTPDPTTLVIKTKVPVGVLDTGSALALPCTSPVPQSYAAKYDKGATSTYGMHQVFTGPYMIQGAGSGTIPSSGYSPTKLMVLVRNPSWNRATDPLRLARPDSIVFKGEYDPTVASRTTLTGTSMLSGDYAAPPTSVLQQGLTGSEKSQFVIKPSGGNRFIALNNTIPPLNNINFRKAIAAIINKTALRLTRGGPVLGTPATHYIPPGMPGFDQAGGTAGPPGLDWNSNPNGSLTVAEKYMKLAGYPTGKYTGPPLLTIADNVAPASNTALAVQSQLAQIGIKLNFREVPHATILSKFCGVPKAKVAICPTLGWGKDFDDAQTMIDPIFNGRNIVPVGNANYAQLNDPTLNAQMNAAEQLTDPTQRAAAWGKLDAAVTQGANLIPWLWDNEVSFASKNVHIATWDFNGNAPDDVNSYLTKG